MDWSWCIGREQADLTAGLSFHSKFQALYSSPSLKFKFNHIHLSKFKFNHKGIRIEFEWTQPKLVQGEDTDLSMRSEEESTVPASFVENQNFLYGENWSLHFFFCFFSTNKMCVIKQNKTTRQEIVRKIRIIFLCTWFSPCTNAPFNISRFYAAKTEVKDQTDMIQTKP